MANIHIKPDAVTEVVAKHFPNKQVECIREYNAQVKASNGAGIAASKLWNVCAAGGLDIKQPADKEKCSTFVKELTSKGTVKFKAVCGDDNSLVQKGTGKCVDNVFSNKVLGGVKVNMLVASGLAKEYARIKYGDKDLVCSKKYRQTKLPPDDYVQCVSMNKDMAYEFRFDSVTATKDYVINEGTESGVCKIFGLKYSPFGSQQAQYLGNWQQISPYQSWPAACETTDAKVCSKVNESITKFGRSAKIGSTGPKGHTRTACVINKNAISSPSQLRTAFGIDNYVFKKGGAQLNATQALKTQVCTYVRTTVKNPAITSCDCNDGFTQLYDFSGMITQVDDVLTCKINGKNVDFVFDDLSESWGTYNKSGHEAMNCIAWGGTFTGKKCIGLDEKMCYKVRDANAQSCPECKKIQWNSKAKICELPASVSATNLKRGLTYSAIVGGAVASVIITIGTAGAGGVTAGTAIIMLVETAGAGIELGAQINIDNKADKFFVESANCNSESCAKELVEKYLTELARIGRDLTDAEADATDQEMARLIGLIPTNSDWWIENLRTEDGKSLLEKADDGVWTAAQVWRAVGIGMQFAGVVSSITGWIIKKAGYLEQTLDRTSKILLNAARTAEQNIVKVDKLDDVGKEWYKLWQEYAPKDQTLEQFKAMANGDLDKMKQMAKSWTPRSKRPIITAQIDKQLDNISADVSRRQKIWDDLTDKYDIDALPDDPDKLAQLYKQHPDLKEATKNLDYARAQQKKLEDARGYYNNTSFSTYDPEFSKTFAVQKKIDNLAEQRVAIGVQYDEHANKTTELYKEGAKYDLSDPRRHELYTQARKEYDKSSELFKEWEQLGKEIDVLSEQLPTQWEVAEKHQLQNLGNVVKERADDFAEIIANNPEIKAKMDEKVWSKLTDQERADVAQKILDEYAVKTNNPRATVDLEVGDFGGYHMWGTNNVVFNPNEQIQHYDGMVETMAHEHGHLIDDLAPNEGALGEQYSYYTSKIYSNQRDDGYRVALTEQSSFKLGPNVSHEATGTTHYSYGEELELERAKEREQWLQQVNQHNKEYFDKEVEGHAATGASGLTGLGVTAGTTKSIIEKKNKKKDKK